jgi:hypothetical protein
MKYDTRSQMFHDILDEYRNVFSQYSARDPQNIILIGSDYTKDEKTYLLLLGLQLKSSAISPVAGEILLYDLNINPRIRVFGIFR